MGEPAFSSRRRKNVSTYAPYGCGDRRTARTGPWRQELRTASNEKREQIAWILQGWFVKQLQLEYFANERVKADISHDKPIRTAVTNLLRSASASGGKLAGAVAQHLVGAKLALRFPELKINNESYTTADQQTDRPGDFHIGDTTIHVTMSPVSRLFEVRCAANISHGYRPRVLVPDGKTMGAQLMGSNVSDKLVIQSIEDFIGTNVEEMAGFSDQGIKRGLRELLEKYNDRVKVAERDPGLLIEIPGNL